MQQTRPFTYVGVGSFCALAAVAVLVLAPRSMHFGQDPAKVIEAIEVQGSTNDAVAKHLAGQMNEQYGKYKPKVDDLAHWYTCGLVLFSVVVAALLLDLQGT